MVYNKYLEAINSLLTYIIKIIVFLYQPTVLKYIIIYNILIILKGKIASINYTQNIKLIDK